MQVAKPKKGYKLVKTSFGKYEKIPEEWEVSSFLDVVKLSGGTQPPRNSFSDSPKEGYVRLLQIRDFERDDLSCYVSKNNNLSFCSKKDILIARYGASLGKIVKGKEGAHNVALVRTIPDVMKIDNNFLFYWLNSIKCQNFIFRVGTRSAQDGFNKQDLKKLDIFLPILPEQQQIASILSNVDDTLQKTNQIIDQTQRLKTGMMQKLLTRGIGHTKFKKVKWLFGKEIEIPKEWEVKEFSELILKSRNGFTGKPNDKLHGIPRLGISSISESDTIYVQEHIHRFIEIEKSKIDTYLVEKNDLLVCRQNGNLDLIGKARLAQGTIHPMIFSDSLISLKIKTNEIMVEFLTRFLDHKIGRDQILRYFTTTAGNYSINGTNLKKIRILSPSLLEQKQIASILSNVDTQIQKEKLHKSNLERLKKGLMQKLLTGQIRVKIK